MTGKALTEEDRLHILLDLRRWVEGTGTTHDAMGAETDMLPSIFGLFLKGKIFSWNQGRRISEMMERYPDGIKRLSSKQNGFNTDPVVRDVMERTFAKERQRAAHVAHWLSQEKPPLYLEKRG